QRLGPVHTRQLEVHQDQVRRTLDGHRDTLLCRTGCDHVEPGELQHVPHQLQVLLVVLHHENRLCAHGASVLVWCWSTTPAGRAPTRRRAAITSSRPTGLTRNSSAPSAKAWARSSRIVTTTTGEDAVAGSDLSASRTPQPSMPGSRMSNTTAAGRCRLTAASPSTPSRAATVWTPAPSRNSELRSRERRSSSATTTTGPAPVAWKASSVFLTVSRSGTEKPNVLPAPTSLSSHIRPPNSSTMRRQSVSPRPVPSP